MLIKCMECDKEISSEAAVCPACGKATYAGQALAEERSDEFKALGGILGIVVGGGIGYLLTPVLPLFGRIPFIHVITGGTLLKGMDQMLVPSARAAFAYLIFGIIGGLILGLTIAGLAAKTVRK